MGAPGVGASVHPELRRAPTSKASKNWASAPEEVVFFLSFLFMRQVLASQVEGKAPFRHSERSLCSEVRFCIARILCDESLFSWLAAKERFLVLFGIRRFSGRFCQSFFSPIQESQRQRVFTRWRGGQFDLHVFPLLRPDKRSALPKQIQFRALLGSHGLERDRT